MKKLLIFLLFLFLSAPAFADHLKGGFMTYTWLGQGNAPDTELYSIKLTLYMIPTASGNPGQFETSVPITIYNNDDNSATGLYANRLRYYYLTKTHAENCMTNAPTGQFYLVVEYLLDSLPLSHTNTGYTLSFQRCCRISGISNISGASNSVGNTYSVTIPGIAGAANAVTNSSCTFPVNDTAVVCRQNYFQQSFQASDPNGDSLSYQLCSAWQGGSQTNSEPQPASPPPYATIPYATGFSGGAPMGPLVTLNPVTGLLSGIAPDVGEYVVTVCVTEWRNGVAINVNRKEVHIKVRDCSSTSATLAPEYVNCRDFNVRFSNQTPNGATSTFWDFGVPGLTNDTANIPTPVYTYPDTGVYYVTLIVNRGQLCSDTARAPVRVFPGFFPGFRWEDTCAHNPTRFIDTSSTRYGSVNFWRWDFGVLPVQSDTSRLQNPVYTYPSGGNYNVQLIVGTDKGCRDTLPTRVVHISNGPPLSLPFRDTILCSGDTLQLSAVGSGQFSWTPNAPMLNPNSSNPLVWPATTTWYTVQLDGASCAARDSIRVRVTPGVSLRLAPDTLVCFGDSLQLQAFTNAVQFAWTPGLHMNDPSLATPTVLPVSPVQVYTLTAHIGNCAATRSIQVRTGASPRVKINDTTICFRASVQLQPQVSGNAFSWQPVTWLSDPHAAAPLASPPRTTTYVLSVRDTASGCPKVASDTVVVRVMPRIVPRATHDTLVVAGQSVQLFATGGVRYEWLPATGLNRPDIAQPIGVYDGNPEFIHYIVRVYDSLGCVDSTRLTVRVFRLPPSIFVPTAFTPNGDGRNDRIRPIAVGMRAIDYFRIYNRWGQLVFETTENGAGWDGRINGKDQGSNVFVWVVKATDFAGNPYFAKGTVTLIR